MPAIPARVRQRGFSALALLSSGALLLSSAGLGLFAFGKDVKEELDQIGRRPSGAFTQAPTRPFLGLKPGRDPHGRGGMWTAKARAAVKQQAEFEGMSADAAGAQLVAHTLAVAPEPGSSLPWEGSSNGVNTGNGNKLTTIHLLDWKVRGGGSLDFTLFHNSQTNYSDELGAGWTWPR